MHSSNQTMPSTHRRSSMMRLGSRVLVVDCRPESDIAAYLCRQLVNMGLSVECVTFEVKLNGTAKCSERATQQHKTDNTPGSIKDRGLNQLHESNSISSKYVRILKDLMNTVNVQYIPIASNNPILISRQTIKSDHSSLSCLDHKTIKSIKEAVHQFVDQIMRIYIILTYTPSDPLSTKDGCGALIEIIQDLRQQERGKRRRSILLQNLSESIPIAVICPEKIDKSPYGDREETNPLKCKTNLNHSNTNDPLEKNATPCDSTKGRAFKIITIQHCCLIISPLSVTRTIHGEVLDKISLERFLWESWLKDSMLIESLDFSFNSANDDLLIRRCIYVDDFCKLLITEVEELVMGDDQENRINNRVAKINGIRPLDRQLEQLLSVKEFKNQIQQVVDLNMKGETVQVEDSLSLKEDKTSKASSNFSCLRVCGCRRRRTPIISSTINLASLITGSFSSEKKRNAVIREIKISSPRSAALNIIDILIKDGQLTSSKEYFVSWTKKNLLAGFERIIELVATEKVRKPESRKVHHQTSPSACCLNYSSYRHQPPNGPHFERVQHRTIPAPSHEFSQEKSPKNGVAEPFNQHANTIHGSTKSEIGDVSFFNYLLTVVKGIPNWFIAIRGSLQTLSSLVLCLEIVLFSEYLLDCCGYYESRASSVRLILSCLTGRVCWWPDLIWRRFGIGMSQSNTLWNSILRIGVLGHFIFLLFLLLSVTTINGLLKIRTGKDVINKYQIK